MTPVIRAAVLTLVCLVRAPLVDAQQAVILVRHAEKADQSKDPSLSEAGRTRARALAALLVRSGVTAIYATQYQRTVQTAQPLADALRLDVQTVPADDGATLVEFLKARHPTGVVVVVGHSNTVPTILRLLGHPQDEVMADDDFGNVFVVVPKAGTAPVVLKMRY